MPAAHSSFSCDKIMFSFQLDELRVTRVMQLFLHLRLNYYEAKIQMLLAFSWKPAQPRFLKLKIEVCSFWELITRGAFQEVKLKLWRKI